jgi:probable HAF family extracellular repeat protein
MRRTAVVVALALGFGAATAAQPHTRQWTIHELPLLPGDTSAFPLNVNNRGQIAGFGITASGQTHAVLWDDGVPVDLGTLGGTYSRAWGINDRGQVVGESEMPDRSYHAFLWQDGQMIDLAPNGGFERGFAINRQGHVAGHVQLNALLWRDGALTELGFLSAWDINERDEVVGIRSDNGSARAVLWRDGTVISIPLLPGATDNYARAINRRGQVVGETYPGSSGGYLWDEGRLVAIPFLPTDINDHGAVVGQGSLDGVAIHALLWQDGRVTDLGALPGGTLSGAFAISDRGVIVGFSSTEGYANQRGVVWTPR